MNPEQVKKILVIRLSSLGDVLLTTPVLRALKVKYPRSEITFLVKPQFADAVRTNPNVAEIVEYKSNEINFIKRKLKSKKIDLIFDLQNNFRSCHISRFIHAGKYRFAKPSISKWLLVKFKINLLKDLKTIPQRYAELFDELVLDSKGLELIVPPGIKSGLEENKNYIGLCPGSQHFTKRWPKEYFIELGKLLLHDNYSVVVFGGKDDEKLCKEITNQIEGSINLQNENNLYKIAADMKRCKLVITNDSGLMHTAAAVDIPVITIFGSSVKEFGFVPYGVKNLILENNSLNCRPCSHIGLDNCPKKHFKCMMDITPGVVFNQTKKFISTI